MLIEGPRACGKTATGRHHAASEVLLDVDAGLRHGAEIEPSLVLEGSAPRLIDEWQTVPSIWNHVRRAVDMGGGAGRFILTGSAVPPGDTTRHTGAGRMSRLSMRPMSLFESGHSTGEMSLGAMLRGAPVPAQHSRTTPRCTTTATIPAWKSMPSSETAGGAWMGVEIKLGGERPIEEGARNLLKLRDRVDPDRTGPPAALVVIVGVGHGYTRPDGVLLAPLTALGP